MDVTAKNIKIFRKQNEWTQRLVAKKLGLSIHAFSKIETGVTDINITRLNEIANLLGVSAVNLISKKDSLSTDNIIEISRLNVRIKERDEEIIALRRKIIGLYEELWNR